MYALYMEEGRYVLVMLEQRSRQLHINRTRACGGHFSLGRFEKNISPRGLPNREIWP